MATANSVPLDAPGVAAKRGEDPAVNSSHGGEEGGGVKDNDNDKYYEGGGGRRREHRQVIVAPSSFGAPGAVANFCVAVVAVGNDDGVHCPPEVCRHCRAGILISPYRNVFILLNSKGKGKGGGVGGGGDGGEGGGEGGGKGGQEQERGRW
jgi:hypothetical protein